MKETEAVKLLEASGLFDAQWYEDCYPDVKISGMKAAVHFFKYGWRMGRDPSPDFSTIAYLEMHQDVKKNEVNPLVHYLRFGEKEGRSITPSSDFSIKRNFNSTINQAAPETRGMHVDFDNAKIAKQLEKTQALLEHYYSRYKELEYQLVDSQ